MASAMPKQGRSMLDLEVSKSHGISMVNRANSGILDGCIVRRIVRSNGNILNVAISVVFLVAFLCAQPSGRAADSRRCSAHTEASVPGASGKGQRVLSFPQDYSLGEIIIQSYPPSSAGRELRGAARGKIIVPAGKFVKFIPAKRFYSNPSIVNTIAEDGIDSIELSASSMDDREDGLCDRALSYVGHLKGLIELNLDRSDATDAGAVHAAELPNLQKVTGLAAALEGKCFKQFAVLKQLRCVHLPRNCLKDENLKYLASVPNLQYLSIGHCNLSDAGVKDLANCTKLTVLNIGDNPKITDQSIKYLVCMKNLRDLTLHGTSITPAGILQLKTLPLARLELPSKYYGQSQLGGIAKALPNTHVVAPSSGSKRVDSDTRAIFAPMH